MKRDHRKLAVEVKVCPFTHSAGGVGYEAATAAAA